MEKLYNHSSDRGPDDDKKTPDLQEITEESIREEEERRRKEKIESIVGVNIERFMEEQEKRDKERRNPIGHA